MIIREEYLVIINSKNRVQRILLRLNKEPFSEVYTINRITGQYGGKETLQPVLTIDKGKVKRTVSEQANLQFNSLLKGYMDKGYIRLKDLTQKLYSDLSEQEIKDLLGGDCVKDQSGIPKPMLAKSVDQLSPDIFEKEWEISRKLNGVRCLMYYRDNEVHTASRGGGTYDVATTHLRTNPNIVKLFEDNPYLILDGELYKHSADYPLQKISGLARLETWSPECEALEYWIYDYISPEPFKERLNRLNSFKEVLEGDSHIKIVEHIKISGYLIFKRYHDQFVSEGFEGLCARNPEKEYGIGKRSGVYLIKMKEYQDAEYQIIGIREGLRPEDMCFTLITEDGKEFAAKPMGDIATRLEYLAHKDFYIGKRATCKYFELSKDGIPCQPILINIRPDDE